MTRPDAVELLVVLLASCIPFGVIMTIFTADPTWLWFCLPALVFMS